MKRIKLIVAYEGTKYSGWQIQPNGLTVQEMLETKISKLVKEEISIIGASRTDAGVHALGNVCVFDTTSSIPSERLKYAINQLLPLDIRVLDSAQVSKDWHPRFSKSMKTHEYHIQAGKVINPIGRQTQYFVHGDLDLEKMSEGVKYLIGTHDFAGFSREECQLKNTIREICQACIYQKEDRIIFSISGYGFLYNMVRMIVGMLILIGKGKHPPNHIKQILENKIKDVKKITAPPQGLILKEIKYL